MLNMAAPLPRPGAQPPRTATRGRVSGLESGLFTRPADVLAADPTELVDGDDGADPVPGTPLGAADDTGLEHGPPFEEDGQVLRDAQQLPQRSDAVPVIDRRS